MRQKEQNNRKCCIFIMLLMSIMLLAGCGLKEDTYDDIGPLIGERIIVREGYKYGVIKNGGEVIVEPQYDHIFDFSQGKAAFKENGLWGYLDTEGNVIIEPQFDAAYSYDPFSGTATVLIGLTYYKINEKGEIIEEAK